MIKRIRQARKYGVGMWASRSTFYSAFSLKANRLTENMGRESSISAHIGHFCVYIELNQLPLVTRTHYC